MARFIRTILGYNDPIEIPWRVKASTTINEGQLVSIDATTRYLVPAVAGDTNMAGIAQQGITTGATVTPDDKITILPIIESVIRIPYVGATKTSLADTDLVETLFNINNSGVLNLDNTTNGTFSVVDYNNTLKYADVIAIETAIKKIG